MSYSTAPGESQNLLDLAIQQRLTPAQRKALTDLWLRLQGNDQTAEPELKRLVHSSVELTRLFLQSLATSSSGDRSSELTECLEHAVDKLIRRRHRLSFSDKLPIVPYLCQRRPVEGGRGTARFLTLVADYCRQNKIVLLSRSFEDNVGRSGDGRALRREETLGSEPDDPFKEDEE